MSAAAFLALFGVATVMSDPATGASAELGAPTNLRCEYLVDPLGIDVARPRLSWEMVDGRRGAKQSAYQILAASDADRLAADDGSLWDTGKVESDASIQIEYAGKPLTSRTRVYWKVRVWDADGQASAWSSPALWTMGLLDPSDWQAKWIGDPSPSEPFGPANNGFHTGLADSADANKWVRIDLGEPTEIDAVKLFPARPYDWIGDATGFLFPLRFRIETADDAEFANVTTVVDRTSEDVPNPGTDAVELTFPKTKARFVRLSTTALRERRKGDYGFALAEMQVLSGEDNVALNKSVTASDSVETGDWSTRKLVDGDLVSHGVTGADPLVPPVLRKRVKIEPAAKIARATAYATALGFYDIFIDGKRVGDRQLAPEWTDFHKRVQYQTYDVTPLLRDGATTIDVQLADGWYAGRVGLSQIVRGGPPRGIYGRRPRFLMQLEIEYADGNREAIVTDDSWKFSTDGPVLVTDLLDGETIDARRIPLVDLQAEGSYWKSVGTFDLPAIELDAQLNEPIRATSDIAPIAISEPKPGQYVFDLGQNMVGWCRLTVRGDEGDMIMLRHAEVLNPDGTIYTDNLRSANQIDRFILAGGGPETFEPRYTYHGFRYVEVTGLKAKPELTALTGRVVHSAPRETARFECSNPLLNKLWANILWTQRANMPSVPTDCPQRDERLGWTGDILAFCQTACFNMDMAAFYRKWLRDLRDAQTVDGRFPDFAPHPYGPEVRFSGVPAWGDAGTFVPWCDYVNYADKRLIAEHYEAARRWVDWIHSKNRDLLWENERHNDYGDWLNADTLKLAGWPEHGAEMPKEAFATAFFARSTELVSKMAAVIGREDDAKKYAELAAKIRSAFNDAYVDEDGRIAGDTQAGYAIALHFGLLPESKRAAAAKYMVECFDKYGGNISTGFHSTICLMNELTRNGYNDEAYRMITNRTMPSWGYAIDHGATTIWERWDGYVEGRGYQNPGMNSFAHYALGSVGEWMMRTVIGINPDPDVPAYKQFILRPMPGGDVTWARGAYDSIHGRIACSWRIEGERIEIDVTVPANTSAEAHLPMRGNGEVTESGRPLADAQGVTVLQGGDSEVVCQLAAGRYHFSAPWAE